MPREVWEKVNAWRESHRLALEIFRLSEGFSRGSYDDLISDLLESAVTIPKDIAVGSGASEVEEYLRRLRAARSRVFQMQTQLSLAGDLGVAKAELCAKWIAAYDQVITLLDELLDPLERQRDVARWN